MNVLIIEDEDMAAERLKKMLQQLDDSIHIMDFTDSVEGSVKWLRKNNTPDLIFADIHLADGHSFDIFKNVEVHCPIIFTTAYDQYAINAFKFNSINYLLKPLKKAELEESLAKFKKLQKDTPVPDYSKLLEALDSANSKYQKRLIIRFGHTLKAVDIENIAYFYTEDKTSHACTKDGKRWPVDQSLEELEHILDPSLYFRINRQFIININAIDSMHSYSKSRVKIVLQPESTMETIVSTDRSPVFKEWLLGKE
ncbi:MAG: LytR/AlgR family response regulator transcription factor [Candidatus Cyclobacteriaceae bacterium M2_1C_046]